MLLKYFLKPLGCLDIVVIVLILIWFLLFILNKNKKLQILIFIASHILFYWAKMTLNKGNLLVPSAIVLLVSFTAFIIYWFNKRKETDRFSIYNSIYKVVYVHLTVALIIFFLFSCLAVEASSILMPPPH